MTYSMLPSYGLNALRITIGQIQRKNFFQFIRFYILIDAERCVSRINSTSAVE